MTFEDALPGSSPPVAAQAASRSQCAMVATLSAAPSESGADQLTPRTASSK